MTAAEPRKDIHQISVPGLPETVTQIEVTPGHSVYWDEYLHEISKYIREFWPDAVKGASSEEFVVSQGSLLKERYSLGCRIYYLWKLGGQYLGLANGYIDETKKNGILRKTFHVAEITVAPRFRNRQLGRWLVGYLLDWARNQYASELVVEVDPHMVANHFWNGRFGLKLVSTADRNVYTASIDPKTVKFIRHGEVNVDPRCRIILDEEKLTLSDSAKNEINNIGHAFDSRSSRPRPVIYTSSFKRALQTANLIAQACSNREVILTDSLVEFFPDCFTNKTLEEIESRYGESIFLQLSRRPLDLNIDGVERLEAASKRIYGGVENIVNRPSYHSETVLVSHELAHAIFVLSVLKADLNRISLVRLNNLHYSEFIWKGPSLGFEISFLNRPFSKG